jgi:hypothetical protein
MGHPDFIRVGIGLWIDGQFIIVTIIRKVAGAKEKD